MSDLLIMAACAVAAGVVLWFVQGLLNGVSAGMVDALPIG